MTKVGQGLGSHRPTPPPPTRRGQERIDLQKDFISSLMDSIDRGVGQLVDADMNKESTRLQALQVQQQLGIQSLSIANQRLAVDPVAVQERLIQP